MKNRLCLFIILFVCNLSFSQNETEQVKAKTKSSIFKFYPNPVQDELYVLGTNKIKTIEFIDVSGKTAEVFHLNKAIIKLDVSQLKSGIYHIKVTDENNDLETKKVIVK